MSQSAYIQFTAGSAVDRMSLEDVQQVMLRYRDQMALTGRQLGWEYEAAAFPYTIEKNPDEPWFYLKGTDPAYRYILVGVGSTPEDEANIHHIQLVLPDGSTHGDKAKANELCKYIAKRMAAKLHLFNGRTIHYNTRK
ncbi:hypothetical protein DNH61_20290 [Paenibacillus sambharensis]|uniref:DUF1885 domain-containing protein n=1 Tax=Paenibacillus sambharensis TaxID=1803190 RepID=A0A2W1L3C0_9BACL|nr:DUF1885 family protein [Paenibacillus sambharensis]PZD93846.1 hypothetical protein DNH61_20290 [Paenibacillus sambharensis]